MKRIKLFESFIKDSSNAHFTRVTESESVEEKSAEKRIQEYFNKLVPAEGPAETVEGEMVRAVMRVWYRYFNDGDYFFRGHGRETVAPSVEWLQDSSPLAKEMRDIWHDARANALKPDHDDEYNYAVDGYLQGIVKAANAVCDYIDAKKGSYQKNETDSSI